MKKKIIIPVLLVFAIIVTVGSVLILTFSGAWGKLFGETQTTSVQLEYYLELQGEKNLTVEYGTVFTDPGARAFAKNPNTGEETAVSLIVIGAVDVNTVGKYTLEYTVDGEKESCREYREVTVADTQIPVITLVSDPEKYTLPGQAYEEEGFTATDNHDGDITHLVQRVEAEGKVTYTVADTFGNTAEVTREIVYNDPIPPELSLKGESVLVLDFGKDYVEPGYTASDNCDGDLTGTVQVEGLPDIKKPGSYEVTYTVKDQYNNVTRATRTVFVKQKGIDKVNNPGAGDKFIYLTFDDGPGPYTEELLDVLAKYNVKATFFVVNTPYIDVIKREAEEGHTVAIHTASHKFKEVYASEDAYFADLNRMQEIIKKYTGQTSKLLRFPGGSSNTISKFNKGIMTRLTKLLGEKGFTYFDWNVDSMDAGGAKTDKAVYRNIVDGISGKKNAVVLMHDIKSYTVDAIEDVIIWGLKNGYTFLPLTADSPTFHHPVNN